MEDKVLYGITDIPLTGNSLIAPELIYAYIVLNFILAASCLLFFYFRKKKIKPVKMAKAVFFALFVLNIFIATFVASFVFLWLLPAPKVISVTPKNNSERVSLREPKIEIIFDKPIDRLSLVKAIIPEAQGAWGFDEPVPGTNLYRKAVFYPSKSLNPATRYEINLSGITNFFANSKPSEFKYSFTTRPVPHVVSSYPISGSKKIAPDTPIEIILSEPNENLSAFDFVIEPSHPIDAKIDASDTKFILTPRKPFTQGVTYKIFVKKTPLVYSLPDETIITRSTTKEEFEMEVTIAETPGIDTFEPKGNKVLPSTPITIVFSKPMNRASVEDNFSITPQLFGSFTWEGNKMTFKPLDARFETQYSVTISKNAKSEDGAILDQDIIKEYSTIGAVRVSSVYPENNWNAVSVDTDIKVQFDQEVVRETAAARFDIEPDVLGSISWIGNTMIFKPFNPLAFSTGYHVTIGDGIGSIYGLASRESFTSSFYTQAKTTRINVPAYLQQYSLSCEIAALRMALAYRGIQMSEDQLAAEVGFDNTPFINGTWGNPNNLFVGNINGRQMVDGYGVHWAPIARVASKYRGARDFTNGSITNITAEISKGNPVIAWTYSRNGTPVTWNTITGELIYAVRGEHAVVVVGYVGDEENPKDMIVNDPLIGQIYMTRGDFEQKWGSLGKSGVVVY